MRLREPQLPDLVEAAPVSDPSPGTEQSRNCVSLGRELGLAARLSGVFAVILLWFCFCVLVACLVKNTKNFPFLPSLSVFQPSFSEAKMTTVGEGQPGVPEWCQRRGREERMSPGREAWCGVSGRNRVEGGTPRGNRGPTCSIGVQARRRDLRGRVGGDTWERVLTCQISTFIKTVGKKQKDHGSQVSHCQEREVQIHRENIENVSDSVGLKLELSVCSCGLGHMEPNL